MGLGAVGLPRFLAMRHKSCVGERSADVSVFVEGCDRLSLRAAMDLNFRIPVREDVSELVEVVIDFVDDLGLAGTFLDFWFDR